MLGALPKASEKFSTRSQHREAYPRIMIHRFPKRVTTDVCLERRAKEKEGSTTTEKKSELRPAELRHTIKFRRRVGIIHDDHPGTILDFDREPAKHL